jgi:hypothetical protein
MVLIELEFHADLGDSLRCHLASLVVIVNV